MNLPLEEIETLSNREGVNFDAVFNFLITADANNNLETALYNLRYDARIYQLNRFTINAIKEGLLRMKWK